jgi:hypothetical protein
MDQRMLGDMGPPRQLGFPEDWYFQRFDDLGSRSFPGVQKPLDLGAPRNAGGANRLVFAPREKRLQVTEELVRALPVEHMARGSRCRGRPKDEHQDPVPAEVGYGRL